MTSPMLVPGAAPAAQRTLSIRNGWLARQQLRIYSPIQNDWVPWTGGTDAQVRYSQFATGYDFNGYPSTVLGPFLMTETSDPGWYAVTVAAALITAAFKTLVGQTVYQVIEADGDYSGAYGYAYEISTAEPLLVIEPRTPL